MKTRAELHAYWRNPSATNTPGKYLAKARYPRSQFLVGVLKAIGVAQDDTILEIGCNSGRNLLHLWKAGFLHLHGIEINQSAVDLLHRRMPFLGAHVLVGPVEEMLKTVEPVDVIFTLAVLVHLHPTSEFVFAEMVKKARKYIVTIEDECTNKSRHCARNYQAIFETLGMKQIYFAPAVPGMNLPYCARAFERAPL